MKKYIKTKEVCNKVYIEVYEEWSGMGTVYLTNSVNFKIQLGRFNVESEYYRFECKQDSVIAYKTTKGEKKENRILEKNYSV